MSVEKKLASSLVLIVASVEKNWKMEQKPEDNIF